MELPEISEKRWCYYVPAIPNGTGSREGHYFVGIVVKDQPGYNLTDWDYGTEYELAEKTVLKMNQQKLGLTEDEALTIVLSSMFAGKCGGFCIL